MSILLDTNILLRSAQQNHPQCLLVQRIVRHLLTHRPPVFIVPQNLYEFWSAATRPAEVNGLILSAEIALRFIDRACATFSLLEDTPSVMREGLRLVSQHEIKGKSAHDARLVASMRVHGVSTLLTFNAADFQRFSQIQVLHPELVTQALPD